LISSTKYLFSWLELLGSLTTTFSNFSQNADLDRQTLSICISLIENGVNPEALAVSRFCLCVQKLVLKILESVVRELKRDAEEVRKESQS
jgi:hypothetical protein